MIYEIPEWMGELLCSRLEKGKGHKYIRRVPTGNPKRPWRYYYRVTGGKQLGHEDELIVGASFKIKDEGHEGHFHIVEDKDGTLTIRHDESGRETKISREALREMLHREHAEAISTAREKAEQNAKDAEQYGSEKQKSRTKSAAEKLKRSFAPKEEPKPAPRAEETKPEEPARKPDLTLRLKGQELVDTLQSMGDYLYGLDMVKEINSMGFNKLDYQRWSLAAGLSVADMQGILRKYKRQIIGEFGEELYHHAGLADAPTGANTKPKWSPFGDLYFPIDGKIGKNFSEYVELQKKYGMRFGGKTEGWFVPSKKLADFDQEAYRADMAELGIHVHPVPERVKAVVPVKPASTQAQPGSPVEPAAPAATEQAQPAPQTMDAEVIRDGIKRKQVHDKIAVIRGSDGRFKFYSPYSKKFTDLFSNKSGALTGITEAHPEDGWSRSTYDLSLVEEAIEKLKALHPDWEIVTKGVEEAKRERAVANAELEKPIPHVAAKLAPGMTLRPYQNQMVRFLEKTNGNAIIGDEMGLGKTAQSLSYCAAHNRKVIVVCPKVVRRTWTEEAEKFFPGQFNPKELKSSDLRKNGMPDLKGHNLVTINYESLEKFRPALEAAGFDTIIVDESHRIKNPKAKTTQEVTRIAKQMKHRLLLSGTAVKNKKEELYTQVELVKPGMFKNKDELKRATIGGTWNKLQEVYLARQKATVLKDLPEKTTTITKIEVPGAPDISGGPGGVSKPLSREEIAKLSPEQRLSYFAMRDDMIERERDPAFDDEDRGGTQIGEYSRVKNELAIAKVPATKDMVQEILDSSDSKVLLFSESIAAAEALAKEFGDLAILHHGQMSDDKREAAKKEFQRPETQKRVFVSTRPSLAVGATLTAADKVVFNDLPWTAADVRQAEDRVHRIGQKNAVNVYWVTAAGNKLDESISDIVKKKYDLSKKINEGKQLSPEERAWMEKPVSAADILRQIRGEDLTATKTAQAAKTLKKALAELRA